MDEHVRPRVEDPAVQELLNRLGVEATTDLGGTMSLNLHLASRGEVLRIHSLAESVERVAALRSLRRSLAEQRLIVGAPTGDVFDVGGRVAELEVFVDASQPKATWANYVWMYEAMGRLHRATNAVPWPSLPEPAVATYATPASLREQLAVTSAAVASDADAAALVAEVARMIDHLDRRWIAPERLPQQLVHGDIRLGNVVRTPNDDVAYFDFGFAAVRPRIHELAYSLFWIVLKPDDSGGAYEFPWDGVAELIAAYEAASGVTLTDLERAAIGPYLAAVPMYFASIAGYTPDPFARIKQEIQPLKIAGWVIDNL